MNAIIKSSFWTDERLEDASPEIKLATLWLITNPVRDLCGFVSVSNKRFTFETGLQPEILEGACKALPTSILSPCKGVYFLTHFLRHQFGKGGHISLKNNVVRAAIRHAEGLPTALRDAFFAVYPELVTTPTNECANLNPLTTPLQGGGVGVRVRVREGERAEGECEGKQLHIPDVVAIYPKRERQAEAIAAVQHHVERGTDLQVIELGTRAIAAVIARMPGGHLNSFVPSAAKFFQNRRWEDDPDTWLRQSGKGTNGAPVGELNLGGRKAAKTIRI